MAPHSIALFLHLISSSPSQHEFLQPSVLERQVLKSQNRLKNWRNFNLRHQHPLKQERPTRPSCTGRSKAKTPHSSLTNEVFIQRTILNHNTRGLQYINLHSVLQMDQEPTRTKVLRKGVSIFSVDQLRNEFYFLIYII